MEYINKLLIDMMINLLDTWMYHICSPVEYNLTYLLAFF